MAAAAAMDSGALAAAAVVVEGTRLAGKSTVARARAHSISLHLEVLERPVLLYLFQLLLLPLAIKCVATWQRRIFGS